MSFVQNFKNLDRIAPPPTYILIHMWTYEAVSKSFRTGRLERELQKVQLSATRCAVVSLFYESV